MSRFALLAFATLLAAPASLAQTALHAETLPMPAHACVMMAHPHDEASHEGDARRVPTEAELDAAVARWRAETQPVSETVVTHGPSATFIVTYTGFDAFPLAQAAYQAAVDLWASHLASSVPIRVTAEFTPLGPGVLGSAGPFLIRNFAGAPETNVWYPYAIADAVAGVDLVPGAADLRSRFSSNFGSWYFGTDANPPPGTWDFRSVVMHELGHGLGFSGSARWDDGQTAGRCDGVLNHGCWGYTGSTFGGTPQVFDLFAERTEGLRLLDVSVYPNPSMELGLLIRSNNLWINGPNVLATFGDRARLYAPTSWQAGSSYSHWNEGSFPTNSTNAMMTPQIAPGERFLSPGPLTCAFFADMGWPLGPGCQALVSGEDAAEATRAGALVVAGANPFATTTTLRLTLDVPQAVEVSLHDALGRRVRTLHDGNAPAGPLSMTVRADGLAPGVYVARASVGGRVSDVRLVVAR